MRRGRIAQCERQSHFGKTNKLKQHEREGRQFSTCVVWEESKLTETRLFKRLWCPLSKTFLSRWFCFCDEETLEWVTRGSRKINLPWLSTRAGWVELQAHSGVALKRNFPWRIPFRVVRVDHAWRPSGIVEQMDPAGVVHCLNHSPLLDSCNL